MNRRELRALLEGVRDGSAGIDDALERVSSLPYEELGFAHVDHHRELRRGYGEAIFCAGKTVAQVVEISRRMIAYGHTNILATRPIRRNWMSWNEACRRACIETQGWRS